MTHNTVVTGYRYSLGIHMTMCHGPIDEIQEIRVAERTAWKGTFAGPGTQDYTDVTAKSGAWPVGPPRTVTPKGYILSVLYRRDRVVLSLDTFEPYVVIGTETTSDDPAPPPTPNDAISLAVVRSRSQTSENYADRPTFFGLDNSARDPDEFEDPDNDLQVSFTNQQLNAPEYEVSSGAVDIELVGGDIFIDKEDLFGGEQREGGIRGRVSVALGTRTQGRNGYLQRVLGNVPAFRNVAAVILEQVYIGTIARLKPWAITAKRKPRATALSDTYAMIGEDANPAHMIYEIITEPRWGMGYSAPRVLTSEFEAAAQTLYNEDFGLSMLWDTAEEKAEDFLYRVAAHIDATVYVDIATGQWRITLLRDDYNLDNVPVLDKSNVVSVENFSRPGYGEIISQLTVTYTDGEGNAPSWKTKAVSQHNLAALRAQGGRAVSQTTPYPGICKASLANRVLARDLQQLGRPLARVELLLPASESDIRPGMVRRWSDPDYSVEQLVIRVVEVQYGTIRDGRIRVKAAEDVFGAADAVYADPTPTDWTEPVVAPSPAPYRRLMEATYYHVAQDLNDSATLLGEVPETAGRLVTQAVAPAGDTYGYAVHIDAGDGYRKDGDEGEHCPTATLARVTGPADTVLVFDANSTVDLGRVGYDEWAYLGAEMIAVREIDPVARTATVDRGILDTVPAEHPVGERVFFGDGFETYSQQEYTDGEQVDVKLLPTTSGGQLVLDQAPADTITFDARFIRPYPPGRLRLNGNQRPAAIDGTPVCTITWAHRDRTQQTGPLIDQDAADIGPEDGTTYTLRIHDEADNLVRTESGLTGTSYTYTIANEDADGGPFTALRFELEAVRDGYTSWQYQDIYVDLAGYGRRYGDYYGGAPQ